MQSMLFEIRTGTFVFFFDVKRGLFKMARTTRAGHGDALTDWGYVYFIDVNLNDERPELR